MAHMVWTFHRRHLGLSQVWSRFPSLTCAFTEILRGFFPGNMVRWRNPTGLMQRHIEFCFDVLLGRNFCPHKAAGAVLMEAKREKHDATCKHISLPFHWFLVFIQKLLNRDHLHSKTI